MFANRMSLRGKGPTVTAPALSNASVAADEDFVYVFGGDPSASGEEAVIGDMSAIWAHNLLTGRWTRVPIVGAGRNFPPYQRYEVRVPHMPITYSEPERDCTNVCSTVMEETGKVCFLGFRILLDETGGGQNIARFFITECGSSPFNVQQSELRDVMDMDGSLASFCEDYSGSERIMMQLHPLAIDARHFCLLYCDQFEIEAKMEQIPKFMTLWVHELRYNGERAQWEWRNISNVANTKLAMHSPDLAALLDEQFAACVTYKCIFTFQKNSIAILCTKGFLHGFPLDKMLVLDIRREEFRLQMLRPDPEHGHPTGCVHQQVSAVPHFAQPNDAEALCWFGGLYLAPVDRECQPTERKEVWVLRLDTFQWMFRGQRSLPFPMAEFSSAIALDRRKAYIFGGHSDFEFRPSHTNRVQTIHLEPPTLRELCMRAICARLGEEQCQVGQFVYSDPRRLIKYFCANKNKP